MATLGATLCNFQLNLHENTLNTATKKGPGNQELLKESALKGAGRPATTPTMLLGHSDYSLGSCSCPVSTLSLSCVLDPFYLHHFETQFLKKLLSDLHHWGLKMKRNTLPTKVNRRLSKFVSIFLAGGPGRVFLNQKWKFWNFEFFEKTKWICENLQLTFVSNCISSVYTKKEKNLAINFWEIAFSKLCLKTKISDTTSKISKISKKL